MRLQEIKEAHISVCLSQDLKGLCRESQRKSDCLRHRNRLSLLHPTLQANSLMAVQLLIPVMFESGTSPLKYLLHHLKQ